MYLYLKRSLDISCAIVGLAIMAIPFAAIAVAIKMDSKGPIIFRQQRMGKDLKPFTCYKFRSMCTEAPHDCKAEELTHRDAYVTRVGSFLRATSLDETPQLINILKGDMSLIGPRPVVLTEQNLIRQRAKMGVYKLRPGLSGLAQISGRNFVTDEEKVAYDYEYLCKASLGFDLKLIGKTILYVVNGTGVMA